MFKEYDVVGVGGAGMQSYEAKSKYILHKFGPLIDLLHKIGCYPIFVGDALSDMEVALSSGCFFAGMTESGEADRERFRKKMQEIADRHGITVKELPVRLFKNIYDPAFHQWIDRMVRSYERKMNRAKAWSWIPAPKQLKRRTRKRS